VSSELEREIDVICKEMQESLAMRGVFETGRGIPIARSFLIVDLVHSSYMLDLGSSSSSLPLSSCQWSRLGE